ncbi:MAG: pre-peptidase [Planctomycetaceae bacterium]|nr:pre-peptidase [Planctomycetaceae bacterium]
MFRDDCGVSGRFSAVAQLNEEVVPPPRRWRGICRSWWMLALSVALVLPGILEHVACAAPPSLQFFFPAGGQQGQTVEVSCAGSFPRWPVEASSNREGIKVEALAEMKQKLRVTIDQKATPGLYFIRMHDAEGATTVRPFAVGSLAETAEQEPNDAPGKPQLLPASTVINGKLNKAGDVDHFSLALKAGQTLVASAMANTTLNSPMDAVLQVCDARGFVLLHNDDERGLDPMIVFQVPRDGQYLVRIFAFPSAPNSTIGFAGADSYVYRLTLTTEAVIDHTFPLAVERGKPGELAFHGWNLPADLRHTIAPAEDLFRTIVVPQTTGILRLPAYSFSPTVALNNAETPEAQEIDVPAAITGRIGVPLEKDKFAFDLEKGKKINVVAASRKMGYALDPLVRIRDSNGKMLVENDDAGGSPDAALSFSAPETGRYFLELEDVNGHGGFRFVYHLTVIPAVPDYQLSLAADAFVVAADKTVEVPIAIERKEGFAEEIVIEAIGLPEGVTAEPVVSGPKGDASKSVKLVIKPTNKGVSGPFSVIGKAGEATLQRTAQFPVAGTSRRLSQVWLTVLP